MRWTLPKQMHCRVGRLLGRISSGALVLFAFLLFSAILHLPREVEHWSADFVASTLSTQLNTQVDDIVLVYVTDATLKDKPYVSPIDRANLLGPHWIANWRRQKRNTRRS
jgi:hypothetical protein